MVVISYFRGERVNYPGIGQSVSGAVDDCGGSDEFTDKQFCQHSPLEHLICSIRWEGSRLLHHEKNIDKVSCKLLIG